MPPSLRAASISSGVILLGAGASASAEPIEATNNAADASAALSIALPLPFGLPHLGSGVEILRVFLLDRLDLGFDGRRVVLHPLDLDEGLAPGLLLGEGV